jgi:hypothetical protein
MSNRVARTDDRESSSFYNLRQLDCDMSGHIIMFGVFWFSCIEVKTSASPKIPVIVLSWDSCTTRGSIWEKYCDTLSRSYSQKPAFLCPYRKKIKAMTYILSILHTHFLPCKPVQIDKPTLGLCRGLCRTAKRD